MVVPRQEREPKAKVDNLRSAPMPAPLSTPPQAPGKAAMELKSKVGSEMLRRMPAMVKEITSVLRPTIASFFNLDDVVRNNPLFPRTINDPYRRPV